MQHIDRLNVIKALVLLEDEQIVRFNIAANDNASQIHMLVDGLGVGLTHEPVAAGMISHRQLVTVLGNMTDLRIPISIIYPPTKLLNVRLRPFNDWISDRFSGQPSG